MLIQADRVFYQVIELGGEDTFKKDLPVSIQFPSPPNTFSCFDVFAFAWFLKNLLWSVFKDEVNVWPSRGSERKGPWT